MKKLALLATVAALGMSAGANAQLRLVNAEIRGSGGVTVWDTEVDSNYTLFLQNPGLGDFLNPNDEAINLTIPNSGRTRAILAGEGFPTGTADSDPLYNLFLTFSNGSTLTGSYVPLTNTFIGGGSSFTFGGATFTLDEFSFRRNLGDTVNQFVATPGGDENDYAGNFRISAAAVPEPAAWALMIVGVGAVGGSMRVRRRNAKVSFA